VEVGAGLDAFRVPAIWKKAPYSTWWMGVCNYCKEPVLVQNDGEVIYPSPSPPPTDERIPDPMRSDLDEAKKCFSVDAWRGCAVIARRSIQAAALGKGAPDGKLAEQITDLVNKGVITHDLKEWADVVRWVGNDAAHPTGAPVSEEDAEDILKLAEQFLHVIYVAPAIAKERKAKRSKS
jgi:hypothetical protein